MVFKTQDFHQFRGMNTIIRKVKQRENLYTYIKTIIHIIIDIGAQRTNDKWLLIII